MNKQPVNINFSQGIETKTDPFQVSLGKFLSLNNVVFNTTGRLTKRNGFGVLSSLPNSSSSYITTFNGNLTAVGDDFEVFSEGSSQWLNKGSFKPARLSVLPVIRNNTNQFQADMAIAENGLMCTVYADSVPSGLSTVSVQKYVISDSVTGQNISAPRSIPVSSGNVGGTTRVFVLGSHFIILFTNTISGTAHLQYIAISTNNPSVVTANADIASSYIPNITVAYGGIVANGSLYIAYNTDAGGQSIKLTALTQNLTVLTPVVFSGQIATMMSVTADVTDAANPIIWASYYDIAGHTGHTLAVDKNLNTILNPTLIIPSGNILNITSVAENANLTFYLEFANNYGFDSSIPSHYIGRNECTQAGVVSVINYPVLSVGLASRAFIIDGTHYFLGAYQSPYQPTYFLFTGDGDVVGKLAYSNGGGYYSQGLPGAVVDGNTVTFPYLIKDTIASVNKNTNVSAGTQVNGVYSQTGVNAATFEFGSSDIVSSEIGSNLNISGGIMWGYDGYSAVEQGFNLWPDSVAASGHAASGSITAGTYYYQATYEWSDNQGNIFRSAPSIPTPPVVTSGSTSCVDIYVPTLRVTYKTANPVKIVIYRKSVAQPTYFQVTSVDIPLMNSIISDYVTFRDTLPDSSIIGNNIIYTNGGVIENIAPPATNSIFLFDDRLWLIPSEDPNLLWYSKQVIENTPVEMSDLFTSFVAPTTSAQGSSGVLKCGAPMDDKAILFKEDAIYYINGSGPDNTGSNNGYSQPTFITSTVGCSNQKSIVFIPQGLMFQSNKGIWLLGRDLSTKYIGSPVEAFNDLTVTSSVSVPGTNQVRFTLDSGVTLMYDYFVDQWSVFDKISAISSTLYQGKHTYLNSRGEIFQETPGQYLDGSTPVLISFKTSWINVAGLRGYERAYEFSLLGTYISPHKLSIQVGYDYDSPIQQSVYTPPGYAGTWGDDQNWGGSTVWGGGTAIEQFRVFNKKQKCKSYQIICQEIFDPSFGTIAGEGLTLSGICAVLGFKKGYAPTPAARSIG